MMACGSNSRLGSQEPNVSPWINTKTVALVFLTSFISCQALSTSPKNLLTPAVFSREEFLQQVIAHHVAAASVTLSSTFSTAAANAEITASMETSNIQHPFSYTPEWEGTNLAWKSLADAAEESSISTNSGTWSMGKWPDPILRRSAREVDFKWLGTPVLYRACDLLERTARYEGAVGLAAQQCGVDARMIYLQGYGVWINPRIVARSSEPEMRVWQEQCLVLPPTWTATVLRDAWIDVDYLTADGKRRRARLQGEPSRCLQHEYDHDRGILVTDHVGLEELESDIMRQIEAPGHARRQAIAYTRHLDSPL